MSKKKGTARARTPEGKVHHLDTGNLHQTVAYHIRRAQLQLWRDFKKNINTGKLVRGQFTVMNMINRNPGITQKELSAILDIDKATLVALIYKLENAGWITKQQAQEDRRRHTLVTTAKGQQKLETMTEHLSVHEKKIRSKFSNAEFNTLIKLLRRIYEE